MLAAERGSGLEPVMSPLSLFFFLLSLPPSLPLSWLICISLDGLLLGNHAVLARLLYSQQCEKIARNDSERWQQVQAHFPLPTLHPATKKAADNSPLLTTLSLN